MLYFLPIFRKKVIKKLLTFCYWSSSIGIYSIWYFKVFEKSKRRKLTISNKTQALVKQM